ncbi:MAG: phosphate acetyltransferase [Oscillospiraceae bacterium]|nr:phosphate acetyltransferase [Oscillospiraceae bacterium]
MSVLDQIFAKAKANPQKVAFPEAENEKMMAAAYQAATGGYIKAVLVGNREKLLELAKERGYDADVFTVVDIQDEPYIAELVAKYTALPTSRLKEKALRRRMQDPLYFAMVMQAVEDADVTFAGIDNTTGDVLLAGQYIIGLQEGLSTVSSIGLCDIPGFQGSEGSLLAIGDSAVCTNPNPEQLADIAIAACNTVQSLLDWEPRCAMVCYSTLGSGQGELIDKVVQAVKIAQEKRPDLAIDGEFQFDAAISPAVAAKKVKRESKVAGKANVVIWPDLNVGNVGVKLIQQFGHADAYGPMLQGFRKVVCDCSRGAPVSEIVGNIVISAVRAAGMKK